MSVYFKTTDHRPQLKRMGQPFPGRNHTPFRGPQKIGHLIKTRAARPLPIWIAALLLVWAFLLGVTIVHAQGGLPDSGHRGIIVLDPGHGGNDTGASGPENISEKQVAMAFAGVLTQRLKKTYKVVLTRKDDYQVDIFERSALANHLKADLFVSIHTGGSFRSYPMGMTLFYFEAPSYNGTATGIPTGYQTTTDNAIKTWEQDRPERVKKSRHLCELIRKRLTQADATLNPASIGAPLIVMAGANMPAVLIEIGTITNPMDAKALTEETHLSALAHAVCDGIDDFFSDEGRL